MSIDSKNDAISACDRVINALNDAKRAFLVLDPYTGLGVTEDAEYDRQAFNATLSVVRQLKTYIETTQEN